MKLLQNRLWLALSSTALLNLPLAAQAVALNIPTGTTYSETTALPGTTEAAQPELAGTVLQDVLTPFSFDGITGTVQNRVVQETGTGTLDFYWKVDVDASSLTPTGAPLAITEFRIGDFGASNITDADWRVDGLGSVAPSEATVFNNANVPGGFINFEFTNNPIQAGQSSYFFFLHTNATNYAQTAEYDLTGATESVSSGLISTFAPAAPVPEPDSYAMLFAGLVLSAWTVRRRI